MNYLRATSELKQTPQADNLTKINGWILIHTLGGGAINRSSIKQKSTQDSQLRQNWSV